MVSREYLRYRSGEVTAGIITLLLIFATLFCGCLQVEPEEMPPLAASSLVKITESPALPANITENASIAPRAIAITSPRQTTPFTEQDFPQEVKKAVSDFTDGKTTDTINGFLRWESVRARTNQSDAVRIREQIHRIDYAVFNTTIQENTRVYIGISGEQAKRIRNESVFEEDGYSVASYDPSVVYHRFADSGRDNDGYLTMCVVNLRRGSHVLFVNATGREFLLPHGGIWDVAGEDTYEELEFSADSIPLYEDIVPMKVRLIHTKEHP
jgi:hypothetical protein